MCHNPSELWKEKVLQATDYIENGAVLGLPSMHFGIYMYIHINKFSPQQNVSSTAINFKYIIGINKKTKEKNENGWNPWGCIYIYIYIVGFNKISLCKHRRETMLFRRI